MKVNQFEILKETWTTLRLSDGFLIRLRPQLVWALDKEQSTNEGVVKTTLGMGAITPPEFVSTPSAPGMTIAKAKPVRVYHESDWTVENRGESLYRFDNGALLELSLLVQTIKRYDVFDKQGEPIVQAQNVIYILTQGPPTRPELSSGLKGPRTKKERKPGHPIIAPAVSAKKRRK